MRSLLFCNVMQCGQIVIYQRSGTCWSHLQRSHCPSRVPGMLRYAVIQSEWFLENHWGQWSMKEMEEVKLPMRSSEVKQPPCQVQRGGLEINRKTMKCPWHSSWTAYPLKMGPIDCPKMSVNNYQSILHNTPKKCISHVHHSKSLKSHICK